MVKLDANISFFFFSNVSLDSEGIQHLCSLVVVDEVRARPGMHKCFATFTLQKAVGVVVKLGANNLFFPNVSLNWRISTSLLISSSLQIESSTLHAQVLCNVYTTKSDCSK